MNGQKGGRSARTPSPEGRLRCERGISVRLCSRSCVVMHQGNESRHFILIETESTNMYHVTAMKDIIFQAHACHVLDH